jgi:hypothetical protein
MTYTLIAEIETSTGIIRPPAVTDLRSAEEIELHKGLIKKTAAAGDTVTFRVGREG